MVEVHLKLVTTQVVHLGEPGGGGGALSMFGIRHVRPLGVNFACKKVSVRVSILKYFERVDVRVIFTDIWLIKNPGEKLLHF